MATDLFLEMAELPATGSLGTGQLDTRDLLVAGVLISISSKYLYLYLALKVLTKICDGRLYQIYEKIKQCEGIDICDVLFDCSTITSISKVSNNKRWQHGITYVIIRTNNFINRTVHSFLKKTHSHRAFSKVGQIFPPLF